jgi:hypothetical protein
MANLKEFKTPLGELPKFKIEKFTEGKQTTVTIQELLFPEKEPHNQYWDLLVIANGNAKQKMVKAKKILDILIKSNQNIESLND